MANHTFTVLDIQKIDIAQSSNKSVKTFTFTKAKKVKCDVLIVGGGVGGFAAASWLSIHQPHLTICLTEETDWLGGQMTAQGVSALDENYLIETSGACRSYQKFRANIRALYKQFKLSEQGKEQEFLNPGSSWVTYLAFEPKFALETIKQALSPAINSGALQIYLRTKTVQVNWTKEKTSHKSHALENILAVNLDTGDALAFEPKFCLDATELGDLLFLANIPYRLGSDSRQETGEIHAPEIGDKENVQDFVYPFVVDFKPGTNNTIEKPENFDKFNASAKFSFNGFKMFRDSFIDADEKRTVLPFWTYRRLIAKENFDDPRYPFDTAMINWDSNDLRGYNIIDRSLIDQAERLALAKSLSLGFLYWLQTEAPRDEGGKGYPELQLRHDLLGTSDALSKYPYIREARRIIAKKTIVEDDIVASTNPDARAKHCEDTLGIGYYPVDIHGRQEVAGAAQATKPFQIPMSALVPKNGGYILPACKNIGVSHITNGAYRLHPIEWAIGEAQAAVVAYCIKHHLKPETTLTEKSHLRNIQLALIKGGAPIIWFDDIGTEDPDFQAIQYSALTGILPTAADSLSFRPDTPMTCEETNSILDKADIRDITFSELKDDSLMPTLTRRQFARWLYEKASK